MRDGVIQLSPGGPAVYGLSLSRSDVLPAVGVWAHVRLALGDGEPWGEVARGLYVVAVTEKDAVPMRARIVPAVLAQPRRVEDLFVLDVSFDLAALLGPRILREPFHLHVAAATLTSEVQRREPRPAEPITSRPEQVRGTASRLVCAYTLARAGEHARAESFFDVALADHAALGQIPYAYDAACAAARAGLIDRAESWLENDLASTEQRLLEVVRALARAPAGAERRTLTHLQASLAAHLDARATDPDLAAWRSSRGI
jgi:hypothetical protein